jgi:proline iminopeptidase
MRIRYPAIEPFKTGYLAASEIHQLYYEEVGNPSGIPVIFLHGGPGVGAQAVYRQFFNPEIFHVIVFSQRGAPKSFPLGELGQNNTWEIVKDIEKLRTHLNIDKWFVFGGSWGSTLGLTYTIEHPDRVRGLVLRGIFLGRQRELDWIYQEGASRVFPEDWEEFISPIPTAERDDIVKAYYQRLISPDRAIQLMFAQAWCKWEDAIIRLIPRPPLPEVEENTIAFARIECHYMLNHVFFPTETYLLDNVKRIHLIPCWISQGRYDMICPVESALELSRQLPSAKLNIIMDAGHSILEPGITDSLMEGIETLAKVRG